MANVVRRLRIGASFCLLLLITACSGGSGSTSASGSSGSGIPNAPAFKSGDVIRAVTQDDSDKLRSLLNGGADINENLGKGSDSFTPLMVAVATHRSDIARMLIARGARLDLTYQGYTAAEMAAYSGQDDVATSIYQAETARGGKRK